MTDKMTKTKQIKEHLISKGSITSWEAIEKYKATRLSAIIFNLKKTGMLIDTQMLNKKDSNGNTCSFANYVYCGMEGDS